MRWKQEKTRKVKDDYTRENQTKWMYEANFGFSHFDVDTQDFQIEGIFFDIYHLKISQTRKLLNFLRLFDQALSCDMQKKISGLLTKSWW